MTAERKNEAFGWLKYYRGKSRSQVIDAVTVPTSWTTRVEDNTSPLEDPKDIYKTLRANPSVWVEIESPPEILYYTKMRNRKNFGQAETEGTPFTQEPLKTKFNWNASTHEAKLVLEGEYSDKDRTKVKQLFIDHLQHVTPTDKFDANVTYAEMKQKMKLWRETTSTSPSSRYLGHYKILFVPIDHSLPAKQCAELCAIQKAVAQCYLNLINYSTKHQYSFQRWKTIINMMIYKELRNSHINRLRVIHIYEADLALFLGAK